MLLIFLLLSAAAHSAIETRLLECAKTLARAHEWVVPMGGNQTNYAGMYNKERHIVHFWSAKNPRNAYFYAGDKLFVVEVPPAVVRPRMVNWNYFVASGLPGGDLHLRYNASSTRRSLHGFSLGASQDRQEFSGLRATARPASAEEKKEALGLYLEYMGYLWDLRESVKNPSWISYLSNAGKGTKPPSAEEVKAMESACAVFFSPQAELNCQRE